MALTPLDIRKMNFPRKLRGYDPSEVESFLLVVAEELTDQLAKVARLEDENHNLKQRLQETADREQELQQTLLQAQKLSHGITENAKHEADVLVREAQVNADSIVSQAIEQANRVETKVMEIRGLRRELQLKLRSTLDMFRQMLEAEIEDDRSTAFVRTLPRRRQISS